MGQRVTGCRYDAASKVLDRDCHGRGRQIADILGENVISSMPIRELGEIVEPTFSTEASLAANSLRYRDFVTVGLILEDRNQFSDNWIYIHDPKVKVGRVQNYKSWSPEMVPDPKYCCYGLEYFCFEGDQVWNMPDSQLIELAKRELEQIGLCKSRRSDGRLRDSPGQGVSRI